MNLSVFRSVPELDLPRHRHPVLPGRRHDADVRSELFVADREGRHRAHRAHRQPLYACPATGATVTATTGTLPQAQLTGRRAAVTNYVWSGRTAAAAALSPASRRPPRPGIRIPPSPPAPLRISHPHLPVPGEQLRRGVIPARPDHHDLPFRCRAGRLGAGIDRDLERRRFDRRDRHVHSALRVGDDNKNASTRPSSPSTLRRSPTRHPPLGDPATAPRYALRYQSFTTHGTCWVDVQSGSGFSGSTTLQTGDFQAAATASSGEPHQCHQQPGLVDRQLERRGPRGRQQDGTTQLRVYFNLDDNNDKSADYIGYYSGDNGTRQSPQLVVVYQ